jgi:rhodanese-related sulfurtransferase
MDTALPNLSVVQLAAAVGTARAPQIVDVRRARAFDDDPVLIPAAIKRLPATIVAWARALDHDRMIVCYCTQGQDVSQGATRTLREMGYDARFLAGGFEAWRASGAPTVRRLAKLDLPGAAPSRWVTRARPKIDRIACPWLIRRFIDARAEILYVPPEDVMTVAAGERAIPFDVPDVQFAHRGERCSFDALLDDFGLASPALARLASVVRGADTGRPGLAPEAAGLLAISRGLGINYADDDVLLARGMEVYDALYAWCRETTTGVP